MKRARIVVACCAGALLAIAAGCVTARHTEPAAAPMNFADPVLERGRQVFYRECHMCHPQGSAGLGPAINNKPLPSFLMKFQVRHGLGAMPSFNTDKISSEELDALIAYLKAMHANKPEPAAVNK
jgi:mono/diheme cytochrome c family protein